MIAKCDVKKNCWIPALFLCIMGICFCLNSRVYTKESLDEVAYMEYPFLQEGDYMLAIVYTGAEPGCEVQVSSQALVDQWNRQGVVFTSCELMEPAGTLIVDFHLDQATESVVLTQNQGEENRIFQRLVLQSYGAPDTDNFFLGACLILLGGVAFFWGRILCGDKYRKQLILILIGFAASLPLLSDSLKVGQDMGFHLARLEGLYQGMRSGAFPVRINPVQLGGFGYLSTTVYPSLFLYPFAALRFIGVSTMLCYKLLLISISIVTPLFAYYGTRRIMKSEKVAMLTAILYTFAGYRLIGEYIRAAVGETMAMAFLPLAAWGVYELFWGDAKKWYLLALGISCMFESHLLSTEMMMLFAVIAGIIWLFKGERAGWAKRVGFCLLAASAVLLWNMWFWLPVLSHRGLVVYGVHNDLYLFALYPSQMFSLFMEPAGWSYELGRLQGEMPLSVGGVLLLSSILLIVVLASKKPESYSHLEKVGRICLCMGGFALFLTSYIFPWELLQNVTLLDRLLSPLQFPWRFLLPASFFLSLAGAVGMVVFQEHFRRTQWVIPTVLVLLLGSTFYCFDHISYTMVDLSDKMQVAGTNYTDDLYLLANRGKVQSFSSKDSVIYCENGSEVLYSDYSKEGSSITVYVEPVKVEEGDKLVFPLYGYKGYQVLVDGEATDWELADNGRIACDLPDRGALIQICYRESPLFLTGDIISLISILGSVLFAVTHKRLNKKIR